MGVVEGRTWLEILPPVACERHLRMETIGRVAFVVDGHPEIFPVNYAVDEHGDIFFRTDPGTKLEAAAQAPTVAFEVDGIDEENHLGWSVVAVGRARWLASPELLEHARSLPLEPWAAGEKANYIRISPTQLTGRSIHRHQSAPKRPAKK